MGKDNKTDAKVKIATRAEDFPRWYTDVIAAAELADYSPVKGCMVIKPYGYSIWENIQKVLDGMFKETGHQNAYFPLFIPEEFIHREAEHVEGFSPELAVVTHAGGKKLEEPLVVRPTSETIINHSFSRWISSWRDLPLLINQWANVVRWELRTRLFLRTSEFLWQEGHTAHATHDESRAEVQQMLEVYRRFVEEYLAIPVLTGKKSDREKFAGALETYTIEAMMQDRKALQCGTSHDLGQNFARAFNIRFQTQEGQLEHVWQTSWGVSTRLIGGLIMSHGDDRGIIIPPEIAPIQVVFVPIWKTDEEKAKVLGVCDKLSKSLLSLPNKIDQRDNYRPAWKYYEWERKGVPMRVEIGPRDVDKEHVVMVRRDTGQKEFVPVEHFKESLRTTLDSIQRNLFDRARTFRQENTHNVTDMDSFKDIIENKGGFIRVAWHDDSEAEAAIKEETGATIRVLFDKSDAPGGTCFYSGKPADTGAVFARSY